MDATSPHGSTAWHSAAQHPMLRLPPQQWGSGPAAACAANPGTACLRAAAVAPIGGGGSGCWPQQHHACTGPLVNGKHFRVQHAPCSFAADAPSSAAQLGGRPPTGWDGARPRQAAAASTARPDRRCRLVPSAQLNGLQFGGACSCQCERTSLAWSGKRDHSGSRVAGEQQPTGGGAAARVHRGLRACEGGLDAILVHQ